MSNASIPEKLLKPYNPVTEEADIYKTWEESGYFTPENMIRDGLTAPDAKPYTIILPPPNVTGTLHMGHALGGTIQDILIRYHRMKGFRTLWIPGTDHAAIATQSKVEKEIQKKEGKSRHDLGREELLKRVEAFAKESHDTMVQQIKTLGFSCDWSREAFTLDEKRSLAVRTVFKMMYDDGLIYRGNRIVNWDPKGQTTISDDEIVHEARKATLYTFKYAKDFPIAISTTRPETKVGDVAVAVHPDDARYKEYVGKEYDTVFCGVPLRIHVIADKEVDPAFGTGALGVTPAHSQTDWDIAERHNLPKDTIVINEYAKMTVGDERLMGKKVLEAREAIVQWLKEERLIEKEESIDQNVATAERTGGIIEPLPKLQWFIDVNKPIPARANKTLKELMREPVGEGKIAIVPDFFGKTYFHWIDNLRDWCISRQIWYGHRVPVWYRGEELHCDIEAPEGEGWVQDQDSLDTWFSSGLWSFSTLGWPIQSEDLALYHPTSAIVPAYEILFHWIARMILMTEYVLGTIPFKTVLLTGVVRDGQGRKFSKSLGNGIDPLDIAAKYGSDAGRMALIFGTAPGTDMKLSEDKIKGMKHFANKIWNITRFVLSQEDTGALKQDLVDEFDALAKGITADLDALRLHGAAEKLYQYLWTRFADEILEASKKEEGYGATLHYILAGSLKLLHPFMPFLTETLWQLMPLSNKRQYIMIEQWPAAN
ncbi:valine--tRNA ligase [Candidatus Nomurabacteria bacterium]|nr:valine--tRNA ligase [Candidatus Nomurabacteria bacterium]